MKRIYHISFLVLILVIAGCGNKKDREMDVEQTMTEIHDDQQLQDKEADDYFMDIPIFEPSSLANEEIVTGADNHLIIRTYLINGVKLKDVYDFYNKQLSEAGWRIEKDQPFTDGNLVVYASSKKRELKIGMDGDDDGEGKYYITMTIRK